MVFRRPNAKAMRKKKHMLVGAVRAKAIYIYKKTYDFCIRLMPTCDPEITFFLLSVIANMYFLCAKVVSQKLHVVGRHHTNVILVCQSCEPGITLLLAGIAQM